MREIKFRAWAKCKKRMEIVTQITWKPVYLYHQIFTQAIVDGKKVDEWYNYDFDSTSNGIVLMQCTNLKDQNGKMIYEGDILRVCERLHPDFNEIGVLKFGEYKHVGESGDYLNGDLGFYVAFNYNKLLRNDFLYWQKNKFIEVVGNIHDNPELLSKEVFK